MRRAFCICALAVGLLAPASVLACDFVDLKNNMRWCIHDPIEKGGKFKYQILESIDRGDGPSVQEWYLKCQSHNAPKVLGDVVNVPLADLVVLKGGKQPWNTGISCGTGEHLKAAQEVR
ncbi:hypothetical protein [Pelagibius sp.]|uniref:hypothetical protein n=1 Tax=Pelagibius sp. TaxID=1931238 RepID=UPI00260CA1AD|nr:hypothetical protein [Pelagibius sp.]